METCTLWARRPGCRASRRLRRHRRVPTTTPTPTPPGVAGRLLWQTETGDLLFSIPALADGVLYFGATNRNLYAMDAATGEIIWQYETEYNRDPDAYPQYIPAVVDGTAYISSGDGVVYAFDAATGTLRWSFESNDGGSLYGPDVIGDTLYVGSFTWPGSSVGYVYALDAATGELQWRYQADGRLNSDPKLHDGTIIFTTFDKDIYALDAANGELRWRFKIDVGDTRGCLRQSRTG